jgi:DNA-binding NarL/FixJ family response regulator
VYGGYLARASAIEPAVSRKLTPREREVLSLLSQGLCQKEIAPQLCLSPKTVAKHIEHLLAKMGVHSRAQAVALALRDGLVDPRDGSPSGDRG